MAKLGISPHSTKPRATPERACERGKRHGRKGLDRCPYRTRTMREWYYIGRAIGLLDAKAKP